MENVKTLLLILCLHFVELVWAASSRNYGREEVSTNQPPRLDVDAAEGQVSLLEIMKGLERQKRPTLSAVASQVQTQRRDLTGQNAHERLLLGDMGRLEEQLESWKEAERNMEHQMTQQSATVESLKAEQAKAIHDEEVAAMVWWDCKMLMCLLAATSIGVCIYNNTSQSCPITKTPSFNAAEPAQPVRKVRAQPEFVEKDAKPEVEDSLQVTLSVPCAAESRDLEAANVMPKTEEIPSKHMELAETAEQGDKARRGSDCQYFSMTEDPVVVTQCATPEEAWWAESSSAY